QYLLLAEHWLFRSGRGDDAAAPSLVHRGRGAILSDVAGDARSRLAPRAAQPAGDADRADRGDGPSRRGLHRLDSIRRQGSLLPSIQPALGVHAWGSRD